MKSYSVALAMMVLVSGGFICKVAAQDQVAGGVSSGKSLVTMMGDPEQETMSTAGAQTGQGDHYNDEEVLKEVHTINTVDTTSGNWLLKRAWWEKTEEVYEQLKETVSSIMAMRASLVSQRNEADRALDILFSEVGVEQGVLLDTVAYAKDLIDKQKVDGVLTPHEKAFAEKVVGKERELEQLKSDIKGIDEIDNKIDQALDIFFAQIDLCNKYEHKAWENFKDIARELNDKEARKLYYNTEALFKDVKNIKQYLENDFRQYFDSLVQKGREHSQKISSQVNALKATGVDIKKESRLLEKESADAEKEKMKDKIAAQEKKRLEEAEKKHKEELLKANSLYSIKNIFDTTWTKIKDGCSILVAYTGSVGSWFGQLWGKVTGTYATMRDALINKFSGTPSTSVKASEKKTQEAVKLAESKNAKPAVKPDVASTPVDAKKPVMPVNDITPKVDAKKIGTKTVKSVVQKSTLPATSVSSINNEGVKPTAIDSKPLDYYEKPQTQSAISDLSYYGIKDA